MHDFTPSFCIDKDMKTKNRFYYAALAWLIVMLAACREQPKEAEKKMMTLGEAEMKFTDGLCKADTDTVLTIATRFMEALKDRKLDTAMKMLHTVNGLQLDTLSIPEQRYFLHKFEVMPPCSYKMDYYCFSTQGNNDVKFSYVISAPDEKQKPTLSIMLNPVKIGDTWYLTLKGKHNYSREQLVPPHKNSPAPMEIIK